MRFLLATAALLLGSALAQTQPDACAAACTDQWHECRVNNIPDEQCNNQFKSCLGFDPFAGGTVTNPEPTTCSAGAQPPTRTLEPPMSTTTEAYNKETDCNEYRCYLAWRYCQDKADYDGPACNAEYRTCLGGWPFNGGNQYIPPVCHPINSTGPPPPTVVTDGASLIFPSTVLMAIIGFVLLL